MIDSAVLSARGEARAWRWCHERDRRRHLRAEGRGRRARSRRRTCPTGRRCRGPGGRAIALVGAGGIAAAHLAAYRAAGFDVAVICNRTLARAEARRDEFFPAAEATDDIAGTLARDDIEVVDITPHPAERLPMIEAALAAGKHVLSQKPFVLDLDAGERLCDLADARGVRLAVNQNGRWAPHLAWMREAVRAGLIGEVQSVDIAIHWDHGWIAGTPFEAIDDLILYDFAVHWFDFLASLGVRAGLGLRRARPRRRAGRRARRCSPRRSSASTAARPRSPSTAPRASAPRTGPTIAGSAGTLVSDGPNLGEQAVTLDHRRRRRAAEARGHLVPRRLHRHDGRAAARGRGRREPLNGARGNLDEPGAGLRRHRLGSTAARRSRPGSVRSLAEARG